MGVAAVTRVLLNFFSPFSPSLTAKRNFRFSSSKFILQLSCIMNQMSHATISLIGKCTSLNHTISCLRNACNYFMTCELRSVHIAFFVHSHNTIPTLNSGCRCCVNVVKKYVHFITYFIFMLLDIQKVH